MIQTENTPSLFDCGSTGYMKLFCITCWSGIQFCLNPGLSAATIAYRLNKKNVRLKEHSKFIVWNTIYDGNFELKKVCFAIVLSILDLSWMRSCCLANCRSSVDNRIWPRGDPRDLGIHFIWKEFVGISDFENLTIIWFFTEFMLNLVLESRLSNRPL